MDPSVRFGKPCIDGTRIDVATVVGAVGLATALPVLAAARAVSCVARGGKAPARDSLLVASVGPEQLGSGLRGGGPWTPWVPSPARCSRPRSLSLSATGWLFELSVLPGLLAAAAVFPLVVEAPRLVTPPHQ